MAEARFSEDGLRSLLAAFWNSVRDDLHERGVTTDDGLPYRVRRLPYRQRVIIERGQLRDEAARFLASADFDWWAELCDLNPAYLKKEIHGRN